MISIRARHHDWYHGIDLLVLETEGRQIGRVNFEDVPDTTIYTGPSLHVSTEAAQTLMDDLWAAGLRPTESRSSVGALQATEAHLADMRKIAFGVLDNMVIGKEL